VLLYHGKDFTRTGHFFLGLVLLVYGQGSLIDCEMEIVTKSSVLILARLVFGGLSSTFLVLKLPLNSCLVSSLGRIRFDGRTCCGEFLHHDR
jgi:hypothetical protein